MAAMKTIGSQISDLIPQPSFGEDIRARMVSCPEPAKPVVAKAVEEPAPKPAAANDATSANVCFEMQSQLALTRLKSRVDPVLPNDIRYYLKNNGQIVVRVKTKISETGEVTVLSMTEGNPILNNAVRNAVTEWKFIPVRDTSGPRCVLTEIPIVIKLSQ
jgi:outer membrane biosynthesis protein TonB